MGMCCKEKQTDKVSSGGGIIRGFYTLSKDYVKSSTAIAFHTIQKSICGIKQLDFKESNKYSSFETKKEIQS